MAKSLSVFNLPKMLAANVDIDYKNDIMLSFKVLTSFLQDNGLLKSDIIDADGNFDANVALTESDLTVYGLALFWGRHIERWMERHDRGTKIQNVKRLEKALAEIRRTGPEEYLKSTRYYIYHSDKKSGC